jgi:hypothetical protein
VPKKRTRSIKVAKKPHPNPASNFRLPITFTEPAVEPLAHPWRIAVIFDVDAETESEAAGKGFDIADAAVLSGPDFDVVCCVVDMSAVMDDLGPREPSPSTIHGDAVGLSAQAEA